MSKSINRVRRSAEELGLDIEVVEMPASTRTAQEAAAACGCDVAQIVKSLVFQRADDGELVLLLVSGANQVDARRAADAVGSQLERADPNHVRKVTGFAIGGVSPLGHKSPIAVWMDETLNDHDVLWAAAGAPFAVFSIGPADLRRATDARLARLHG